MLPSLRTNLDFMPSPVADRPGLTIRDPFQYSDTTLIIPPALVACLEFFDGQHGELDLREFLVRLTGNLEVGDLRQGGQSWASLPLPRTGATSPRQHLCDAGPVNVSNRRSLAGASLAAETGAT